MRRSSSFWKKVAAKSPPRKFLSFDQRIELDYSEMTSNVEDRLVRVDMSSVTLEANLTIPKNARGIVLFAHGSGSSRRSPRNRFVAGVLQEHGLATLLMDLLTSDEEEADRVTGHLRFDIPMLANRLEGAAEWIDGHEETRELPKGLFGASTGAAAALITAARRGDIAAVVSRGGRPDLAGEYLRQVEAPTLLIVGEKDRPVIQLNEDAAEMLGGRTKTEIVPNATHLFEEEGALETVADLASDWFVEYLHPVEFDGKNGQSRPSIVSDAPADLGRAVAASADAFDDVETAYLDPLLDRIADARVVLIGEATHGTSEFYRMRQRITQELIRTRGFNIVAVEADWPDAEHVDEYVRGREGKPARPSYAFARFPSWMWRNYEVYEFVEWLRGYNSQLDDPEQQAAFYGLDLYSLYTSIEEVLNYLADVDPDLAGLARERYECLSPFRTDPGRYGSAVLYERYEECQDEVVSMLSDLLQRRMEYSARDGQAFFDASQNARVVTSAEKYYKLMYLGGRDSWNLRDSHMLETLEHLLSFRGPESKAVLWAHNSHVGDAAATEMSRRGETNVGRLARDAFPNRTYIIGFGTHTGTVAAASSWGGEVEFKEVRPSRDDSHEFTCHSSGIPSFLLPLERLEDIFDQPRLERAIGVIYRPETERMSHYFEAHLSRQFDEYIWFDESAAVKPFEPAEAPSLGARHPFLLGD